MPAATPIHVFEAGGGWIVTFGGADERFGDRSTAIRRATALAREHSPSQVLRSMPANWSPASPAAPPSVTSPAASDPAPDPADAAPALDDDDWFSQLSRERPASPTGADADPYADLYAGWGDDDSNDSKDAYASYATSYADLDDEPRAGGPRSAGTRGDRNDAADRAAPRVRPQGRPAPSAGPIPTVFADAVQTRPERGSASPAEWVRVAGPDGLGRSLLLEPGAPAPAPWAGCDRLPLTEATLADPATLDLVRTAFFDRTRLIFEVDRELAPPAPGSIDVEPWQVEVDADFVAETAWALATANAVDGRGPGGPTFRPADGALALGATTGDAAGVDLVLPDGRRAWCDGGPLHLWTAPEVAELALATGATAGATAGPGATGDLVVIPRLQLEHDLLQPLTAAAPTADLAPDQLAAVAEAGPRARIIAPAGSGKTRVLTERARHLLGTGIPPSALCLVAFNKRAQIEMQDRTPDLPGLRVQTLNALALAIVNGSGSFRSRGATVRTIDELAVRRILGDLVKFPRRANTDPAAAWIDALSSVRLGLRSPADVEREYNGDVDGFAEFFPQYRRALRTSGSVDFDEQIYLALEALLTEPETRRAAQRHARLLLVDEFQDLTPAHMLLLRLLAGPELGIFGVGDDDQTIYGYSGASPDWLVHFDRYVPAAGHHALEVNYRCPEPVVTAASNLLSRNGLRVPKAIVAGPRNTRDGASLQVIEDDLPVTATVDIIRDLLDGGAAPADIAVLTRVNTLLAPVQAALHSEGIPVFNREGARFTERTGVAAALSWLRLAIRPEKLSSDDIQRAARRPSRGLSPRVAEWMGDQRQIAGLDRLAGRMTNERDGDKVRAFARDIERIARVATTQPTAAILSFVRTDIGLDSAMQTLDAAHRGRNSAAHSDDLRALIALGRLHPDPKTFFAWLKDALEAGSTEGGVQLSTVHKVKGLEWPHVIVYDATDGVFPHRLSTDIEEERRVFHVAITRAQQTLHVVADAENPTFFLHELTEPGAPPPPPAAAPSRSAGTALFAPAGNGGSRRSSPEVVAVVGLELSWAGYDATVTDVGPDSVSVSLGRSSSRIPFGSDVSVGGRPHTLVAPSAKVARAAAGATPHDNPAVLDALKAWRSARAKTDAVPAYVVAADRTLNEIASLLPRTPRELLAVNGIGPAKVDRYGDEILAVLEDAAPPAPA